MVASMNMLRVCFGLEAKSVRDGGGVGNRFTKQKCG
jgi:hypothetical protein